MYAQSPKGQNYRKDDSKILELIEILGLKDYLNSSFQKLSSGMQKRALLLSLILSKQKLIILDEPTENLDIKLRAEFLKLIEFISKEYKVGIMITSHNIDEIENIINYVIVVKNGKIVHAVDFTKIAILCLNIMFSILTKKIEVVSNSRIIYTYTVASLLFLFVVIYEVWFYNLFYLKDKVDGCYNLELRA